MAGNQVMSRKLQSGSTSSCLWLCGGPFSYIPVNQVLLGESTEVEPSIFLNL